MPAKFHEEEVTARLKDRRRLSTFLDALIRQHLPQAGQVALRYIFCTDAYLHRLNQQFLDHDTLTDIITFDLSEENDLISEIYISTERVADNARDFKVAYRQELHRVIFHGALHLCGYRDKSPEEAAAMRSAEDDCLRRYFASPTPS